MIKEIKYGVYHVVHEGGKNSDKMTEFKDINGDVFLRECEYSFSAKEVFRYEAAEQVEIKKKQTANGEVEYAEDAVKKFEKNSYTAELSFQISEEEMVLGLGQGEDGIYDLREQTVYLYQSNMRIAIPFIISTKNYGILLDTESAVIFRCRENTITFSIDTCDDIKYYVIRGNNFDEIIGLLREVTGRASMLPRWIFGYIQSRERYKSSEELIETTRKFRELNIPLDCIVQDWLTWDNGLWGEKIPDKERFPSVKGLTDQLHRMNTKLMISIWPNMAKESQNYREMEASQYLLPNSNVYNAYSERARDLYWKQCEEEWFSGGVDAWWCDNAEPFSDPDWNGAEKRPEKLRYDLIVNESKRYIAWDKLNSYGLYHARGIYENWRKCNDGKRVVNLTRSIYTGGQQYGVLVWSGDISARWSTLKAQITEGINVGLSGFPYWTLDIGGFFTVKENWSHRGCGSNRNPNPLWFWNGEFEEGVDDYGYRELYTRWLQYGTFLPIFRSHGTDTPREPWNFGHEGEIFYDAIVKFIRLRYRILPYVYSLGAKVHREHGTMIRSLLFDFAEDRNAVRIKGSYMFGNAFLVTPITRPMYYLPGNKPMIHSDKSESVYLPQGASWYNYWTGEFYEGGTTVSVEATIDIMPLFVKAGSIIPMAEEITFADENKGYISELRVYEGADGEITLYNDDGDNYSFEQGNYSAVKVTYLQRDRKLVIEEAEGKYKYQSEFQVVLIDRLKRAKHVRVEYMGKKLVVDLKNN